MGTKKLKSKPTAATISTPHLLAIEAAKAHRRYHSRKPTIDLNLTEATLASLSSTPKLDITIAPLPPHHRPSIGPVLPRKPSRPPKAETVWTIAPLTSPPEHTPTRFSSAPFPSVLSQHLQDIHQRLETLQQQLTVLQQQSSHLDSTMVELRSLSQQMNAIARPALTPPPIAQSLPAQPQSVVTLHGVMPTIPRSSEQTVPIEQSDPAPVFPSRSTHHLCEPPTITQSTPPLTETHPITPAITAKPSLICIRDPDLLAQLRTVGTLVFTDSTPLSAAPPAPTRPKASPAPDRIRRPIHLQTVSPYFQQRFRIPPTKRAIVIDGSLWILSTIGLRIALTSAMQAFPVVVLPVSVVLWLPTIAIVYLAFFVPQSNVTVIYRLLLLALGFSLGSLL